MARSQIGFHVFKILEEKKLKQSEIAGILGIAESDVSQSDKRTFQTVHNRQAPGLPQTTWAKSNDRSESSP
jgi:predicted XRE-type DNA-binding protein